MAKVAEIRQRTVPCLRVVVLKVISYPICLIIVSAMLLCGCETEPPQQLQTSIPPVTIEQPVTEPAPATLPSTPEPTRLYANIPYDLMPYVEEAISYDLPLDSFRAMFGEESIRYTENIAYTVADMNDGKRMFIFFDVRNRVFDTVVMGEFPKDEDFLDYILGQRVTVDEMMTFTSNYLWMFSSRPIMALYTQEGYYMLEFGYDPYASEKQDLYLCQVHKYVANDVKDSWTIVEEDKR